jgi:hypothetical protein
MTTEQTPATSWWTTGRTAVAIVLAAAVVAVVWSLLAQGAQQRETDRRSDLYFCTMEGVGPADAGPRTGELCADLLDY